MIDRHIIILGTRGIPAQHGGFETFAESLCQYLIARNWKVTVYCQEQGQGVLYHSEWKGTQRIHILVKNTGALGTIIFDLKSILHSLRYNGIFLTLGYNTAIFSLIYRLTSKKNIINMDGIEWKRKKWGNAAKAWFWINEHFGCWFGNHLVADHPHIARHLENRVNKKKITMIPYGASEILAADEFILRKYGLEKNNYAIIIARSEPENSILEIVKAFSVQKRNANLLILGKYDSENISYHSEIMKAASGEVIFPGAIYDSNQVSALRFFARFYVHGHQVGGTNPSLVEALGAGNAVLAHDNQFNRWVAKDGAIYFHDIGSASCAISELFINNQLVESLREKTRGNFQENFRWNAVLEQYEKLFLGYLQ